MARILYVGTKNASSWALRAWLALREQGIAFEERDLLRQFGERYRRYREQVGMLIPHARSPMPTAGHGSGPIDPCSRSTRT